MECHLNEQKERERVGCHCRQSQVLGGKREIFFLNNLPASTHGRVLLQFEQKNQSLRPGSSFRRWKHWFEITFGNRKGLRTVLVEQGYKYVVFTKRGNFVLIMFPASGEAIAQIFREKKKE
ncbi:hypothetical protein ATANTOWER_014152 [Ataeniobius toweri]|uniref:LAGLIDADG homing endonuclease n=1 Tax=Ataeniobius toweri TaxID=208326 RepID=A0ABU7ARD4_9TELE|nr:hypothetical protein [Ataeniobius toweri]